MVELRPEFSPLPFFSVALCVSVASVLTSRPATDLTSQTGLPQTEVPDLIAPLRGLLNMTKLFFFNLSVFVLSSFLFMVAPAQRPDSPQRIEPKAGGPAVIIEGAVAKGKDVDYVFSAKAGQHFIGRITKRDSNTGFSITDPSGEALPEEENDFNVTLSGSLKKTGDYKITVSTFEERSSKYTLSIRVT
jgi:hypothetical protein